MALFQHKELKDQLKINQGTGKLQNYLTPIADRPRANHTDSRQFLSTEIRAQF